MAPFALALKRLHARRGAALGSALAVAAATGLLLAVTVLGALAREDSARGRVGELSPRERMVQMTARLTIGGEPGVIGGILIPRSNPAPAIRTGRRALAGLGLGPLATVLVGGPVSPSDERGTRLVRVVSGHSPRVVAGRAPRRCDARRCEVLALGRRPRVGTRLRLRRVRARVVGRAELAPALAPRARVVHGAVVAVGDDAAFLRGVGEATIIVVTSGVLRAGAVPATELSDLAERMRQAAARAERSDPGTQVVTPAATLRAIDARARTAQRRLLLVGAQGAALFLAFAALLGVARRPDAAALDAQLRALGAARWQPGLVRATEIALPALAGTAAALALAVVAARATVAAVPVEALALVAVLALGAILAEYAASGRPARAGPLELVALACLAVIVWQALATGGLDAARVSDDAGLPVLLLVPGLALFAGGVLVARALPWGFRGAERLARGRSVPARLALLGLTRGGGLAAAATTFLALALGGALFALDYRTTLHAQLEAQAAFRVGTSWRAPAGRPSRQAPGYAVRADAKVSPGGRLEDARAATLLALPPKALQPLPGWNPPPDLERRLHTGARVSGPELDPDAVALRIWARSGLPASLVVELLAPGQRFERVDLGSLRSDWSRLRGRLHLGAGVQVVGLTVSSALPPQPSTLELGRLEQRTRGGGWSAVDDLRSWLVPAGRARIEGRILAQRFDKAPIRRGIRAELPEADVPLLRPPYPVPKAIPAIVSRPLARYAVDRRLTALVDGRALPIAVVGESDLLPTVTRDPDRFVLVDYDTLVAVVSAQRPGAAVPTELWFSGPPPPGTRLSRAAATDRARRDALATGASSVLAVTAALAGVLAAAGLLLAAGSTLRAERGELAGWQALGAGPSALARAVRLRVMALYLAGTVAALAGAALALRLVVALVAVTAGGGAPLPPIAVHVDWVGSAALIAVTGAVAGAVAVTVARATLRRVSR